MLKPPGMTSFDVVAALRGIFRTKKIGHTGTLDPGAVGVLPICIGSATKAIEFMTEKDKVYRAELTLGVTTDTQDSSGQVTGTREVNLSLEEIEQAVKSFVGKYDQVPPMYSAVKVDGRKLYELAREGVTIERKSRSIEIYAIDILRINDGKVLFDVACSKGTYVRTLCHDIGEKLGCGAHMSFLIRLKAGNFDISSALTFEEIDEYARKGSLGDTLIHVEEVFKGYDKLNVDPAEEKRFLNGGFINVDGKRFKTGDVIRVHSENNTFIAIGEVISREGCLKLKSKKFF